MHSNDWHALLDNWDKQLQGNFYELRDSALEYGMLEDKNISSIRKAPCAETEISSTEERLGVVLPGSYKSFLQASNGALLIERCIELLPVQKIDWFKNIDPYTVKVWTRDYEPVPDEQYFIYGKQQDCIYLRTEYLPDCIAVSTEMDGDIYLLNPNVKDNRGEWEAWWFGHKNPGAYRYRSFWELMVFLLAKTKCYIER